MRSQTIRDTALGYALRWRLPVPGDERKTVNLGKSVVDQEIHPEAIFLMGKSNDEGLDEEDSDDEDDEDHADHHAGQVGEEEGDDAEVSEFGGRPDKNTPASVLKSQRFSGTVGFKLLKDASKKGKKFENRFAAIANGVLCLYKSDSDKKPLAVVALDLVVPPENSNSLVVSSPCELSADQTKELSKNKDSTNWSRTISLVPTEAAKKHKKAEMAGLEPFVLYVGEGQPEEWLAALENKASTEGTGAGSRVFGVPLERLWQDDSCKDEVERYVPALVRHIVPIVGQHLQTVGIFRLSGSQVDILNYRSAWNRGEEPDMTKEDNIHTCCGLLKLFFREMPEPLFPFSFYDSFIGAAGLPEDSDFMIQVLRQLLAALPRGNFVLTKYLVEFLVRVSEHGDTNKMFIHNLATVFGPNLLAPEENNMLQLVQDTPAINGVTSQLIKHPEVFSPPSAKDMEKGTAMYDFEASEEGELALTAGDQVLIQFNTGDGWLVGARAAEPSVSGKFPETYVQIEKKTKKQQFLEMMGNTKEKLAASEKKVEALRATKEKLEQEIAELEEESMEMTKEQGSLRDVIVKRSGEKEVQAAVTTLMDLRMGLEDASFTDGDFEEKMTAVCDHVAAIRKFVDEFQANPKDKHAGLRQKTRDRLMEELPDLLRKIRFDDRAVRAHECAVKDLLRDIELASAVMSGGSA